MTLRALLIATLLLGACLDAREAEVARVHAHLARVDATLEARAVDTLTVAQRRARADILASLRAYIAAEAYPTNDVAAEPTPIFIDHAGTRCAMAYLIEASGDRALVARIAREDDYAHVAALTGDPELVRWLDEHGLTLAEAAAIQPSYANTTAIRWAPTFSVLVSAQAGARFGDGATSPELWVAGGVRAGMRRVERSNSSCDECVFRSNAIVGEYTRGDVVGRGGTNRVGVLVQHDLEDYGDEDQVYVLGGPLASLDERREPGSGLGAELGIGFSLQRRAKPWLVELVVSEITHAHGPQVHAGVNAGFVW